MRIGPYEIVERIGEGGAGLVFRARAADGRDVAVKVLRQSAKPSRFERETRLLGELGEEQGFVPLLDSGESNQGRYLVMPFLAGGTLRKRLEAPMDADEALDLGVFLARTLARAHAKGIVHRDLKPENILLTEDGRPLVADLGLAKHFDRDAAGASQSVSLSRAGEMRGTAGYMAPEQMKDASQVGPEADVFAIGAILYECLTGQPAFEADNMIALFEKVEGGKHVPLRSARRDTPTYVAAVVERALQVDPSKRWPDAAAMLDALTHPPRPARRRTETVVVAALVAVALLVGGVAIAVSMRSGPAPPPPPPPRPDGGTAPPSSTSSTRHGEPAWLLALPERERPRLPAGVKATATPGEWRNEKDGTVLVRVPGGDCKVGVPGKARSVSVPSFLISKYEITNEQFERFAAATKHVTSCEERGSGFVTKLVEGDENNEVMAGYDVKQGVSWRNPDLQGRPDAREPVIQVSWDDADAYCRWAGLALPNLEQWEKAASWDPVAKRARRYTWGDERPGPGTPGFANLSDGAYFRKYGRDLSPYYEDGVPDRAPVGSFPLDCSPCGALDMAGNVSEWCGGGGATEGALGVALRQYRGGNWSSSKLWALSTFAVEPVPGYTSASWIGFRPILER